MAYGSILNQNPILRDANGYIVFTSSGTFNPADFNLPVGTLLNIVCVGGGQGGFKGSGPSMGYYADGGAAGCAGEELQPPTNTKYVGSGGSGGGFGAGGGGGTAYVAQNIGNFKSGNGGDAGEVVITSFKLPSSESITVTIGAAGKKNGGVGGNTTFGSYVTARGGGSFTNNIAKGGAGGEEKGNTSLMSAASGGGGGGGYIISLGLYGGNGGNGIIEANSNMIPEGFGQSAFIGGAGGSTCRINSNLPPNYATSVFGGNGGLAGQQGGSTGIGSGLCIVAW